MTQRYDEEPARQVALATAHADHTAAQHVERWRVAKQVTLGFLLAFGMVQTAHEFGERCRAAQTVVPVEHERVFTYSGIGVHIQSHEGHHVVTHVIPGTPADGRLFPGAILISVDGQRPGCAGQWARMVRGPEGTSVTLNVAYPGRGHEEVTLVRRQIQVRTPH